MAKGKSSVLKEEIQKTGANTIEIVVKGLKRYVDSQRAILEFRTPVPRNQVPFFRLLHKYNRIQDARDCC